MTRRRVQESARRWGLAAIAAVLVLTLTAACGSGNGGDSLSVGDTAPGFSAPVADGGNVTLTSLTSGNDAVVIVFYRGFG